MMVVAELLGACTVVMPRLMRLVNSSNFMTNSKTCGGLVKKFKMTAIRVQNITN